MLPIGRKRKFGLNMSAEPNAETISVEVEAMSAPPVMLPIGRKRTFELNLQAKLVKGSGKESAMIQVDQVKLDGLQTSLRRSALMAGMLSIGRKRKLDSTCQELVKASGKESAGSKQ